MSRLSLDIFCRVIDNYGDAGVCWRLAHQLSTRGHAVRLWIDHLDTLARLVPAIQNQPDTQTCDGVTIGSWALADQSVPPPSGIVIEAFACSPPPAYLAAMAGQRCLWINLEYLSAESWVDGCHGLPSPQSNGLDKYFYFPGFSAASGGLLREDKLLAQRDLAQRQDRRQRLQALTGLPANQLPAPDARLALLFCYPDAPLTSLQAALAAQDQASCLLVPGDAHPQLSSQGALQVLRIPFVPQAQFDALLWCCDLNFVRGEDSLVRALWAGVPLVWHIYRQTDDTHLDKLDAWLERAQWPAAAKDLTLAWNRQDDHDLTQALAHALQPPIWQDWQHRCRDWSAELSKKPDLAHDLIRFCQVCQTRQASYSPKTG